jgi:hypothetical protein
MNNLSFKIFFILVLKSTVAQRNFKYGFHCINNHAHSFSVKVLTSVGTGALYLADLNVPFATSVHCSAGYNVQLYFGIIWVEVHIHCNKLSSFLCSYPYKLQIKQQFISNN